MLKISRVENETWLDAIMRSAARYGLEEDVRKSYMEHLSEGLNEEKAALSAALDWDICEYCEDEDGRDTL